MAALGAAGDGVAVGNRAVLLPPGGVVGVAAVGVYVAKTTGVLLPKGSTVPLAGGGGVTAVSDACNVALALLT